MNLKATLILGTVFIVGIVVVGTYLSSAPQKKTVVSDCGSEVCITRNLTDFIDYCSEKYEKWEVQNYTKPTHGLYYYGSEKLQPYFNYVQCNSRGN